MYYLYSPDTYRESVTVYETYDRADQARRSFEALGLEAYICEYGYPFAPSRPEGSA